MLIATLFIVRILVMNRDPTKRINQLASVLTGLLVTLMFYVILLNFRYRDLDFSSTLFFFFMGLVASLSVTLILHKKSPPPEESHRKSANTLLGLPREIPIVFLVFISIMFVFFLLNFDPGLARFSSAIGIFSVTMTFLFIVFTERVKKKKRRNGSNATNSNT